MKDMKDISASAQEALEHARDKAFGKVKSGIQEPSVHKILIPNPRRLNPYDSKKFQF